MDTQERVQNHIQQIKNTIDTIRNTGVGSVIILDLIDFSTDTSETKQTVYNIQTLAVRNQLIQTLVNSEYAFDCARAWYEYINERIPGGFTYDRIEQFVNYYVLPRMGHNEEDIVDDFINDFIAQATEESAKEESKAPANLRY